MSDIHQKFQALKALYPDDIERITADEKHITDLLQKNEFYNQPETQSLIDLCRRDIVMARTKLATDRSLNDRPEARRELWAIIDARLWFLERAAQNYSAELKAMDQEIESALMVAR